MGGQLGRSLKGYVKIRVRGEMPERFLNLCGKNGLILWTLKNGTDFYEMNLPAADVFRLKPFLRKSGCRITILEKHGAPFFFHRTRKRKAFFLGFLLAASILYLLSSFIWNIQVTGNRLNSTQAVLEVLEREGIRHGQPKGKISCQRAADLLREEFENVVWVSARIQGTRLVLEIKENTESFAEEKKEERVPSDLRATKEGTVVRIVTRSGVPKVKVGDPCEKGTVLISGRIPITDDSGEVIRTEEVAADGDVYLSSVYHYQNRIPRRYERRIYEEKERDQYFLQLFQWRLTLGGPFRMPEAYDQITKSHMLRLTENFILPVIIGRIRTLPYRTEEVVRTDAELKETAAKELEDYMADLRKKGVEISSENVTIAMDDSACTVSGPIYAVEKNGMQAEIEEETMLPERNLDT